jgi:hypothetical protein
MFALDLQTLRNDAIMRANNAHYLSFIRIIQFNRIARSTYSLDFEIFNAFSDLKAQRGNILLN